MKSYFYTLAIAVLGNFLILSGAYSNSPILTVRGNAIELGAKERSPFSAKSASQTEIVDRVDKIAQQITVRIDSKNNGNGSGVIIAKQGNTYYALTAAHVVKNPDLYTLITPDARKYPIAQTTLLEGVDLAVIQFTSDRTYTIATIGNYSFNAQKDLADSQWIFVSGFPGGESQRLLTAGKRLNQDVGKFIAKDVFSLAANNGYELVYSNQSRRGMSGGAVLDAQGRLIGINAASEDEIESDSRGEYVEISLGNSLGVPIKTF
ncbi:MAG: trypsin-like peptidase domain-containing protein [Hydrococcus sp. CRU_1_1]|nr:trypsin-like peptidase domain-containing protein [Hydrococcus sp. CRU_1_1]